MAKYFFSVRKTHAAFVTLALAGVALEIVAAGFSATPSTGFVTASGAAKATEFYYYFLAVAVAAVGMGYAYKDKLPVVKIV